MPTADLRWCMAKPSQYCKVIILQLKKKKKRTALKQTSQCGPRRLQRAARLCRENARLSGASLMHSLLLTHCRAHQGVLNGRSSWNRLKTISRKEHSILCYRRHLDEHFGKKASCKLAYTGGGQEGRSLLATQNRWKRNNKNHSRLFTLRPFMWVVPKQHWNNMIFTTR